MKCDKCDNNSILHYQSIINGDKTEYRLCADCANKEGFGEMLNRRPQQSFGSMSNDFWSKPTKGYMPLFVMPFGGFLGRGFMSVMTPPQHRLAVEDPEKATECSKCEKDNDNIPEDAGEEIRLKRELSSLKHQLENAVKNEEFEKAAELRDKIREMEQK